MLPVSSFYSVYPQVVPADTPAEMTVTASSKAFFPVDGTEYTVRIIPICGDEPDYYELTIHEECRAAAKDGVIRFTYTFGGEQEFLLILFQGEKKLQEMSVYALKEDLYSLTPLKGDLHSHSFRSDGNNDPSEVAGHFREQGYDFYALTDHNRYYPGGEADESFAGVRTGLCRIPGEEVHAQPSVVHIVHVGGSASVSEIYTHQQDRYAREVEDCLSRVPDFVPEPYRERYALGMWASEQIHRAGGLAIFPHPFWRPGGSRMHNVSDELARLFLMSGMFDAYELLGAMGQPGNNRSVALWGDLRAEGLKIPIVASSDVHQVERSATFPHLFTVCFASENQSDAIIGAVKAGLSTAVEATGDEYARQYRVYGSLRLVTYTQFLLRTYYPQMQRIAQGAGVAMRAYAMGDGEAAVIEMLTDAAEKFRLRFFGRAGAPLPSAEMLEFEERWRDVHRAGPHTKGSSLKGDKITRQI